MWFKDVKKTILNIARVILNIKNGVSKLKAKKQILTHMVNFAVNDFI